ncbi:MAG: four helix bundle protein [bacterium]
MGTRITRFWELEVYKMAFKAALEIFEMTRSFPVEEGYSLTDQIRRSSRSVTGQIAEAWHKRGYQAAFVSKLNDAEVEAAETQNWLFYANTCGYLNKDIMEKLKEDYDNLIGKLLIMINNPEDWVI